MSRIAYEFRLYFEVTVAQPMVSRIKGPEKEGVSLALFSASLGCSVWLWAKAFRFTLVKIWNYERKWNVTKKICQQGKWINIENILLVVSSASNRRCRWWHSPCSDGLEDLGFESQQDLEIFSSSKSLDRGPPSLQPSGYRDSFQGLKRPEREVNNSPPSTAEDKWSFNFAPILRLHGVESGR